MGAGDGGEIRIAQLELDGSRLKFLFAQATRHHLREPRQCGFQFVAIGSVFVISVFVTDGFWSLVFADIGIEPAAGIFANCFAGKGFAPGAKCSSRNNSPFCTRSATVAMPS